MTDCTCGLDDDFIGEVCEIHVGCDQRCGALRDPATPDEVRAACEHWRRHQYLGGCSHGH